MLTKINKRNFHQVVSSYTTTASQWIRAVNPGVERSDTEGTGGERVESCINDSHLTGKGGERGVSILLRAEKKTIPTQLSLHSTRQQSWKSQLFGLT